MHDTTDLRQSRSLDGEWMFEVDPDGIGMTEGWQTELAMWLTESEPVDVPHVWQEDDDLRGYTGTAWYNRTFHLEGDDIESRRAFIEFGAVDYWASVWVNGELVGENRGGYLPFEFEITDAVEAGENTLTVAVHDPQELSEIPHGTQGDPWYTRVSGIWQSVTLSVRPETYVESAAVTPDLDADAAHVDLDLDFGGHEPEAVQAIVRAYQDGTLAAIEMETVSNRTDVRLSFDDPVYWSPDSPVLYDLEVTLKADGTVIDRYEDTFGLRTIERDEDGFKLNGEPIRFRGVIDKGYYPKTLYRPPSTDVLEREIELASELGFNLVRKHLKPAHPRFLELADREGILVWEEPASPGQYTDRSKDEVRNELRRLVDRDYNHPSVVIWSLYNEEWGIGHDSSEETLWTDEAKQTYLASLVDTVRSWDPTRLVCDNSGWAHVDTDLNDYHRYCISPDRATEWTQNVTHALYHRTDNYATQRWSDADEPVVISEVGAWALPSLSVLVDHYGRDPAWFSHEFIDEAMKRPSGVRDRFDETGLDDVFGTIEDLADAWQRRARVSIEHILGELRTREEIDGYVLSQLTDTEWEFTGILDYCQNEKILTDAVAELNEDAILVPTVDEHTAWAGDGRQLGVALVNDTGTEITETVEWTFGDESGSRQVTAPPYSVVDVEPIALSTPRAETVRTEHVTVRGSTTESEGTEPITVVPPSSPPRDVTVFAEGPLGSRLARAGLEVTHRFEDDVDVAFVTTVTDEVVKFVENGGTAVQIPDRRDEFRGNEIFDVRTLPQADSWENTASFFYQDSPLLADLCSERYLCWEFEDIYPYDIVSGIHPETDTVHVGYVRGWLADWGSPLLERSVGDGRFIACSFRVQTAVGSHPVATELVLRLIASLCKLPHPTRSRRRRSLR